MNRICSAPLAAFWGFLALGVCSWCCADDFLPPLVPKSAYQRTLGGNPFEFVQTTRPAAPTPAKPVRDFAKNFLFRGLERAADGSFTVYIHDTSSGETHILENYDSTARDYRVVKIEFGESHREAKVTLGHGALTSRVIEFAKSSEPPGRAKPTTHKVATNPGEPPARIDTPQPLPQNARQRQLSRRAAFAPAPPQQPPTPSITPKSKTP